MNQLFHLQKLVANALKAAMPRVPILTEEIGDLENEVERIAAEICGLVVVVQTATAVANFPNTPGPILDPLTITVSVFEEPTRNRSKSGLKLTALDAVLLVIKALHLKQLTPQFPLACDKQVFSLVARKPFIQYEVNFITKITLTPRKRL